MPTRVSVCMAVHNGSPFLGAQLESILSQLRPFDELVAVDDGSSDDSFDILRATADARVRAYRNPNNAGVRRTFERALRLATGEVLFLSDQDDLWLPDKVSKTLALFEASAAATMVVSDATIIDATGLQVAPSFLSTLGGFSAGPFANFVKNKCPGCTMAFRRSMLEVFLPIPDDVPMHDVWFAVLNGIFGQTHFIDEPLVAYRRHGANASPLERGSFRQSLGWRWSLAKNVLLRLVSNARARARSTAQ